MYNHKEIEKKWQKKWEDQDLYKVSETQDKPKYYILDMFPYPSGVGLHVGHPKGYIATDVLARMKMMKGFNVLHPMGWDAFGLPAENYAIKMKAHPKTLTDKNIETYKKQLKMLGFTYDWDREINTTDSKYYKWTQWMFLQMLKKGLAYESNESVNWCPSCKTVLANEDLEDGKCERCDSEIEQKPMRQWVLRITDYADRMLEDLDKLPDWEDSIKEMQRNWIGRSEGARVKFSVILNDSEESREDQVQRDPSTSLRSAQDDSLEVFTTRPDTLFGCTFMVVAPEHPLVKKFQSSITNYDEIIKYQKEASRKTELERTELQKDKTGVKIEGLSAINPVNNEEIPVFIADYVMMGYGTGAIMAVPAHDGRDFEFAKKYKIKKIEVVKPLVISKSSDNAAKDKIPDQVRDDRGLVQDDNGECFIGEGVSVNSDFLDGLKTVDAKNKIIKWLEEKNLGKKAVNYRLQDWVFSRQRYWGEPIPVIHCDDCGVVPVPENELPVELPRVESYEPTGTGESPLASIKDWVNAPCPKCGAMGRRETNTMPQWAGSSWYYLRYIDPHNDEVFVDKKKEKYWSPVDFYVGGAEHATRHLIYVRFWHKFLFDIGAVSHEEPFTKLRHVGLIMAEDGRKMSKRWGNVVNPDDVIEEFGADAMRIYEMFMGPFSQSIAWSTPGIKGSRKFIEKIVDLADRDDLQGCECKNRNCGSVPKSFVSLFHKTIKKVGDDIEKFHFNTAISQMMILVNEMNRMKDVPKKAVEMLLQLLSPFAPHIAEELWEKMGHKNSILKEPWPSHREDLIKEDEIDLVIQVNGKLRDTIKVSADIEEEEAKKVSQDSEKVKKWIDNKEVVKIIFVKGKLINIVIK